MIKKILVTGGAGYIGSHVVKALGLAGHDIVVYDNLSTGNRDSVLFGEFFEGDLSDIDSLRSIFKKHHFDGVMHFAGSIKVPESVENPQKYYANNTRNSFNLIECCKEFGVDNFIFSSTAAVYGNLENGIADENEPKLPINPYGRSKLMTEWMLSDLSSASEKFNYFALRYFNVSGADPDGQIGQAFPEPFHLINIACETAVGKRSKMSVFGSDYPTEDGTCVRDYIHVSDLASAHVLALEFLFKENKSMIANCGYGHGFSVKEIIKMVKDITKVDFEVDDQERRDGDPATLVSKADKIRKILNWNPKFDNLNIIISTAYEWEKSQTLKDWREGKAL